MNRASATRRSDSDTRQRSVLTPGPIVTIALSVYAHGLTARSLTERYTRWWYSHPRDALPTMESVPAAEHRLRVPSRVVNSTAQRRGDAETDEPLITAGHA